MSAKFGPAGNSNSFYEQGYKSSLDMPGWLNKLGLNAYEYQCTRGANLKEQTAQKIGRAAVENGIELSIHAPYYINLATTDPYKQEKSKEHIIKSMRIAKWMGAVKVVFHPGSASGVKRRTALDRAKDLLASVVAHAKEEGLDEIMLAPETMGKHSQLGNLEEVLELCSIDSNIIPTVDFAHLHALGGGSLVQKDDFACILDKIARAGDFYLNNLHIHFSPIEYTSNGEKKHHTLLDEGFGPPFQPLADLLAERELTPVVICESNGRQAEDALIYRDIYKEA